MPVFITLEGTEGVGKSTALAYIQEYLNAHYVPFISTREPGGTPLAEKIRQLLLTKDDEKMAY
nr:dTMP kinase [Agitococcus sp.]